MEFGQRSGMERVSGESGVHVRRESGVHVRMECTSDEGGMRIRRACSACQTRM